MKLNIIALALAATAFGAMAAQADELVIKERMGPNGVVIKENERPVVKERITTGSEDCSTKSVTKTDADRDSSKTVTTKKCD